MDNKQIEKINKQIEKQSKIILDIIKEIIVDKTEIDNQQPKVKKESEIII
jgi:hypothetical protein